MQWNIKRALVSGNTAVVEWYFKCDYEGNVDGFDGVTIAEFGADMKICDLKEFQSKAEHYYPYGESRRFYNLSDVSRIPKIGCYRWQP